MKAHIENRPLAFLIGVSLLLIVTEFPGPARGTENPLQKNQTIVFTTIFPQSWSWIQKYVGIKWLQFAPFVEVGRVAPEWSFSRLHSDMKWDAGLGLRASAKGIVIRIDSAYSDEGVGVQMMISQPFQF